MIDLDIAVPPGLAVYPTGLHGAACAILEPGTVAHTAPRKPFAAGPVVGVDEASARWRLGWLTDDPPAVRLAAVRFGVTSCAVLSQRVRRVAFAELAGCEPARFAEIELVSPLFFARNGRDYPLPDPVLIVRSTLDRWDAHTPKAHTVPADVRDNLIRSVYLGHGMSGGTVTFPVSATIKQTGFVGVVPLALTRSAGAEARAVFAALMRFAAIAGVGAQTTHGFGATRLIRVNP